MNTYIKHNMKVGLFLCLAGILVMSSCAGMREKKAEHHQPFSPHKNKKPHHGHPQDHNHQHPH